jgi:hypothetical protein
MSLMVYMRIENNQLRPLSLLLHMLRNLTHRADYTCDRLLHKHRLESCSID